MGHSKVGITGLRTRALLFVLAVIFSGGCATAENSTDENPVDDNPEAEAMLEHFVPRGWIVFESATADLDGDGDEDVIALIENERNAETQPPGSLPYRTERYLMIVNAERPFPKLAALNGQILRARGDYGMSGGGIELEVGKERFSVSESGGSSSLRWRYERVFEYSADNADWYMVECTEQSHEVKAASAGEPETTEYPSLPYFSLNNFAPDAHEGACPDPDGGR